MDDLGNPIELHEGHLTNVVAALRATDRHSEVEEIFEEIDRRFPYTPIDEDKVNWAPDVQLQRAKLKREEAIRAAIAGAVPGAQHER